MVVKAGIITGDTAWELSLASWFLAMKSEEGKRATFFQWPKLDILFTTQAWISLWCLPEAKTSKNVVRCLRPVSFIGAKGAYVNSLSITERFHFGKFLELGSIPVKGGEQPVEV